MQLADQKKRSKQEVLSPAIYVAMVDWGVREVNPGVAGTVRGAIASVMTALKTGNQLVWPCAVWLSIVGIARAIQTHKYELERRGSPLTPERAAWWESHYKILADVYASALGLWCVVVLLGSDDTVAHMLCASVTIGYTAASAGRNYGRPKIIQFHILYAFGPLSLALIAHGTAYYVGLRLLLVPFFIGFKYINMMLHTTFVDALTSSIREAAPAGQFDSPLNKMPHRLCMVRAGRRVAGMTP